jgi:hypothetical protein
MLGSGSGMVGRRPHPAGYLQPRRGGPDDLPRHELHRDLHGPRPLTAITRTVVRWNTVGEGRVRHQKCGGRVEMSAPTARGRLNAVGVFHSKSGLYGIFMWARVPQ